MTLTVVNIPPDLEYVYLDPDDYEDPAVVTCIVGSFFDYDGDDVQSQVSRPLSLSLSLLCSLFLSFSLSLCVYIYAFGKP